MMYPEPGFEYEQKCARIAEEIEMLILDTILTALERLNSQNQEVNAKIKQPSADTQPF